MRNLAVKVLAVLMAGVATITYADLPKLSQDKNLSVISYDKSYAGSQASESHMFFSDGVYCYLVGGGGGFAGIGGKWHYQNAQKITVNIRPMHQPYFAYWDYDKTGNEKSSVYMTDFVTVGTERLLLGFGGVTPNEIAWYEPKKHDITQLIPPTATYLFLGTGEKNAKGDYQLMRFSLKSKPTEDDRAFNFYLSKDYNSLDKEAIKRFKPSYQLKNQQLIYSNFNTAMPLDTKDALAFELNLDTEQGFEAFKFYDYCQSGKGSLFFYPKYEKATILQPTIIQWKGTPLTDNWQKAKNELF